MFDKRSPAQILRLRSVDRVALAAVINISIYFSIYLGSVSQLVATLVFVVNNDQEVISSVDKDPLLGRDGKVKLKSVTKVAS